MICQYCHAVIADGSAFCTTCGKPLSAPQGAIPAPAQKRVVKCSNGHFYDASEYAACPHCGAAAVAGGQQAAPLPPLPNQASGKKNKKEKKPLFHFGFHKDKGTPTPIVSPNQPPVGKPNPYNQVDHTVALLDFDEEEETAPTPAAEPSRPMNAKKAVERHTEKKPAFAVEQPAAEPIAEAPAPMPETPVQPAVPAAEAPVIEPVSAPVPTPTPVPTPMPRKPKAAPADSSRTIAIYGDLCEEEPVVGWLVCINGAHFGQSFQLIAGKNRIGRSPMMDVALMDDDSVSRDTHATIIYEPKKRIFILMAGESKGLTYCNDELILEHAELHSYDQIQLGECRLVFVPFCCEKFTWDSFQQDAEK